jgi:alkaline phosphatase
LVTTSGITDATPASFAAHVTHRSDEASVAAQEVVKQHLAIELNDDEAGAVANDNVRKLDPANYSFATSHSLAFVLRPYLRVGWASQTHTASPLFAFGTGPGSERIRGFLHNTELFTIMRAAMD